MNESSVTSGCDKRAIFVALLKDFSVVLNKSMLPKVASAKEKAWGCLADQFSKNVGKQTSVGHLKKLLNNMKTPVKKKTDDNATGNKPITLLSWEADFLKICDSNENPVYCKILGLHALDWEQVLRLNSMRRMRIGKTKMTPLTSHQ